MGTDYEIGERNWISDCSRTRGDLGARAPLARTLETPLARVYRQGFAVLRVLDGLRVRAVDTKYGRFAGFGESVHVLAAVAQGICQRKDFSPINQGTLGHHRIRR